MARPARRPRPVSAESFDQQEARSIAEFSSHFHIHFHDPGLLRLALTHRSYLSVTGMGPRESNERLEFLGDSVLGLVTSEYLYRHHPDEHEGQLTKTKSLLVSKAILSRRALQIGLGRFILMSHAEMESGGRKRASILADAFESVLGAIYLDQGFDAARRFVVEYLLRGSREIVADKRHRNYKSQLQEYVQSTFHTHPVYRIRSQAGPDHSKLFLVEVMVGRRTLGAGRGTNKKEAEQAAARDAMEQVSEPGGRRAEERVPREPRETREPREEAAPRRSEETLEESAREGRRSRRGGRGRRRPESGGVPAGTAMQVPPPIAASAREEEVEELEPRPDVREEDDVEEVGRPEGPIEERYEGPFETGPLAGPEPQEDDRSWEESPPAAEDEPDWSTAAADPLEAVEPEDAGYAEPLPPPGDEARAGEEEDAPLPSTDARILPPRFGRRRQRRR